MIIPGPYLIFLGDVTDPGYAKTAYGLVQWSPERCVGQLRYPTCSIDLGLPDMDLAQAVANGAKTLLIGVAPVGGAMQANWLKTISLAIAAGLSIASGLHSKLNQVPELVAAARQHNVSLLDVRTPPLNIPVGTGKKRLGNRLLTIGTDCAVGKKYAALAITQALKKRGLKATFRATGQTGMMIAGEGLPIDSIVSDFVAGAAESLSPDNTPDHWDIIEGQGSLFHPAYAGVSLGLLHGSQPDAVILCHNPTREHLLGYPNFPLPSLDACINQNLALASLTNADVRCIGICVNTSQLTTTERDILLKQLSQQTDLPCVDPLITSVLPIVEQLIQMTPTIERAV